MSDHLAARRANLDTVLRELAYDGLGGQTAQAIVLGINEEQLTAFRRGKPMSDNVAREIEWAAQKPSLWMDIDHAGEPPG